MKDVMIDTIDQCVVLVESAEDKDNAVELLNRLSNIVKRMRV